MAFDSWWLDTKLGVRMLVKYPGLTLAGGAGIAVAVAIAAGAFSVIQSNFVASSLPLEEGSRVVSIELWDSAAGRPEGRSLYDYHLWRQSLRSVQQISAFRTITPNIIAEGVEPESVRVAAMSASGFAVARVRPLLGRAVEEGDEREGAPAVVVIAEEAWRNRFASDPAILGRTIRLGATPHSIIGVMPSGYAFPVNHRFWVPLRTGAPPAQPLTGPHLSIFGRMAPGATLAGVQAELSALSQRTALAFPRSYANLRPQAMPYSHPFLGMHGSRDVAGLVQTQGLLVSLLLLVSLNVAILVYTRTAMRQEEIGLRTALGASRSRIVTQLFLEALVLSIAAALAGVAIAAFALAQVVSATVPFAADLPFWLTFRLTPQAMLYSVALSVAAAVIVGVVPGLKATAPASHTGLRIVGAGGMRFGKTWTALIVAQVAFAVALLPPAVSTAWENLWDGIAGLEFPAEQFLSAELAMDAGDTGESAPSFDRLQSELTRRLEAEPRVASVTFSQFPLGNERNAPIEVQDGAGTTYSVSVNRVANNFFRSFDVPVLAGRGFEPGDDRNEVVILNLALARKISGGAALGRRIRYVQSTKDGNSEPERWREIIGVVPDFPPGVSPNMRDGDFKMYHAVAAGDVQPAALAIRMRNGTATAFPHRLRELVLAVDPRLHVREVRGLDEALRREQWISRLQAAIAAAVTVSVLILSSAGIYALMSFTVSQRRKEIAIRMALGADRARIVTSIFSRALVQLACGAAMGAALIAALDHGAEGELLRGSARVVVPGVTLIVVGAGLLAALAPARRSLHIQPVEALREQ